MRWTIRAKLTALVLAALAPLVVGAVLKFWYDLGDARAQAEDMLADGARGAAQQLDEVLRGQVKSLRALASVRVIDRLDDAELRELAGRARASHPFLSRFLTAAADGRVLASSDPPGAPPARGLEDDPAFLAAIRSREAVVSAPRPALGGGPPVVALVVPFLDDTGRAQGALMTEVDLARLAEYLDGIPAGHGVGLSLMTRDGRMVTQSEVAADAWASPSAAPALAAIVRAPGEARELRGGGQGAYLGKAARLGEAPWLVIATVPIDIAYEGAWSRFLTNILGLAGVTLTSLLLAWLVSRRMSRSVQTLITGARGLASGAAGPIAVATSDELAELAQQLNRTLEERGRAQAGLEERQRKLQALAEVNLSLSQQLEPEPLLRQITQALAQLTGAPNVVLWEVDPEEARLVRRAWTTDPSVERADLPPSLGFDQGMTGWIARHQLPLFLDDITGDGHAMAVDWASQHDLLAFAGAPVVAGGVLLGVLTLNLRRGRGLGTDDRQLLSSFAAQAAVAMRNARLFAETEARRRAAERLAHVGRFVAGGPDPEAVSQQVSDSVRELLGTQSSIIYRLDPESGDLHAMAVSGDVGPGFGERLVFPRGTGVAGLAVRSRGPVATPNVLTDPRITLTPELRRRVEQAPYRSVLAVPLIAKDRAIGALGVGDREGRVFGRSDMQLIQAFADQAALALENAELYAGAKRRQREAEELARVARSLTESLDVREVGQRVVESLLPLFGVRFSRLRVVEPDGSLRAIAWAPADGDPPPLVLPGGAGVAGRAVEEGRPIWTSELLADDRLSLTEELRHDVASRGQGAALAVPLRAKGRTTGVLVISAERSRSFSTQEVQLLQAFADQAALALENARLYRQLEARLQELQATQTQLVEAAKLSAVGQLVSGVAHELNNPLSVVIGHGQLLLGKTLASDMRRPVELIVSQGERMAKIVQNLLLFSRQRTPERGPVRLSDLVEQTVALRAAQLRLCGIRLDVAHAADEPYVTGDSHQLQQVVLNLLLNAEQAILGGNTGDRIRITTLRRERDGQAWAVLLLEDDGPGIPPEVLPRIFDPFFTTQPVGQGTGLGLSVSYGIVRQHGGQLWAESVPRRTVFTLELPAMAELAPVPEPAPAAASGAGSRRLALVVEDEPHIVGLVSAYLEQAGWEVDSAPGGRPALERIRARHYDLILADIRMTDGSGEELYRRATAEQRHLAQRFLFMTGETADPAARRFLEGTRAPVLAKPFTVEALLQAVEQLGA
jgi:two-component system, NtrC family, sensor kinase